VGVRKPDALLRKAVEIWCGNFGAVIVATNVTVAEVIGQDEKDVGQ
jgi:hypothetical protein